VSNALRKPFGVWMLTSSGERWNYCNERTLDEALLTARTLRGELSLFPKYRVWIAAPAQIGVKQPLRSA
jgi:hypothetical protein